MVQTMRAAKGVGLAAPQVGVSKRIVVAETDEANNTLAIPLSVLILPTCTPRPNP
jgi:peptide deformylase